MPRISNAGEPFRKLAMTRPQVLIADDDGEVRNVIAEFLTREGVRVMQAADGKQASSILKENPSISVLLSDVRMPRMDGYALVEEALTHNPELKVLMMTGYAGETAPEAALKARELGTLIKPFSMDVMWKKVLGMLARP